MSVALRTSVVSSGDREQFDRASNAHRDLRPLLTAIGVQIMSSAQERLTRVLKMEEAGVRSGMLANSLNVTPAGSGSENTIFEVGKNTVEVGSNLAYAAQVHHGGTIVPRPPRGALAIPLRDSLKRDGIGPRELDPGGDVLRFVPGRGGRPPLLIDPEGKLGHGEGPLYVLPKSVTQAPRPFMGIDDEDERVMEELYETFLGLAA